MIVTAIGSGIDAPRHVSATYVPELLFALAAARYTFALVGGSGWLASPPAGSYADLFHLVVDEDAPVGIPDTLADDGSPHNERSLLMALASRPNSLALAVALAIAGGAIG